MKYRRLKVRLQNLFKR